MLGRIYDYLIPDSYKEDEAHFRKARIYIGANLITFFFSIVFLLNTLLYDMDRHMYAMIVCAVSFFLLAFALKWGVSNIIATHIFVFIAVAATFWDGYFLGGINSSDYKWIVICPILALLLGNIRTGYIWLAVSLIATLIMAGMQFSGYEFQIRINPKYLELHGLQGLIGLIIILFISFLIVEKAYLMSVKRLNDKNILLDQEKSRSHNLLLNILPVDIIDELQLHGRTKARQYEQATVLFADFVGFTVLTQTIPPEELVKSLDEYFGEFDHIISKYDVEKIKTVGDAYICASGLPIANDNHASIIAKVAKDMISGVEELNKKRTEEGRVNFNIRVGINSGPVVAGVVGTKKFAYDIWGDTVNTAARMESNSSKGHINVSQSTYNMIKDEFSFEHRGQLKAKGKGQLDMYYLL